jgi:hypothetical protein
MQQRCDRVGASLESTLERRSNGPIMVLEAACQRLEAAIDRLEAALATREASAQATHQQLDASLQAAQAERADLTEVNRTTLERLDQTIGRLRGLLAG